MDKTNLVQRKARGRKSEWAGPLMVFACNFFKHPGRVGWLLPSSPFLVDEVLKQIDWERARVIVEYGPGVGTFTHKVLEKMRPDAKLVAFEINPDFIQLLKRKVRDPRFHLATESAAEVDKVLAKLKLGPADYVISGIPFRTIPHALRDLIVRKTYSVLKPQGHFLIYQLSGAVLPYLESVFGNVSRRIELRNLLPTRLYFCAR